MKAVTRIERIVAVEPYRITCLFQNKQVKTVDLKPLLDANPVHKLLKDLRHERYFMQVSLDEIAGLRWPHGFDTSSGSRFRSV